MLRENLENALALPKDAVDWLMALYNVIQVFDDAEDGDPIDKSALRKAIWDSLAGFYQNPFFVSNASILVPVMATSILKWHGANTAERNGTHNEMSFAWRAGYYDIVLLVVSLVHGHEDAEENAHVVMSLYGEKFADYAQEFGNA